MQTSHRWVSAVAGIALSLIPVAQAISAEKSGRLSGSVMNVSNDKSEITIRYGTAGRVVEYNSATTFTRGSASDAKAAARASSNDVAPGNYLTCVGSWDGVKLAATNCTIRPSKRP